MTEADVALQRLVAGNARFVAGEIESDTQRHGARREELVEGQAPFAIILSCSDSRVPVEIIFDQGLGDLFVIRVAGNIASATQLGSIEFAARFFGARLVVVLGHTGCGAMAVSLDAVQNGDLPDSDNLRRIIDAVRPAVEDVVANASGSDHNELVDLIGRENVRRAVDRLRTGSGIIRQLAEEEGLRVVGAEYSLATGAVQFF